MLVKVCISVFVVCSTMIRVLKITKPLEECTYILCVCVYFHDTVSHFPVFLTRRGLTAHSEGLVLRLHLLTS